MTTRSNFACDTPLLDPEDKRRLALAGVALGLAVVIVFILVFTLRLTLGAQHPAADASLAPAAANHAAGAAVRAVPPASASAGQR